MCGQSRFERDVPSCTARTARQRVTATHAQEGAARARIATNCARWGFAFPGWIGLALALAIVAGLTDAALALLLPLANGSFEQNGGVASDAFATWTVSVAPGSSGSWYVQAGTANPLFPTGTADSGLPPPPDGAFAAMTDENGRGSRVLYQDVQLPFASTTLTCAVFLDNQTDDFIISDLDTLGFDGPANQHFRIDIVDPAAPVFSVAPGDVLQNVYISSPGSPGSLSHPMSGYTTITAPLDAFAGETVRLRFAQVDNQYFFNVGTDQCVIEECIGCVDREVVCDDCLDNDGDGLVDRDDPDCPALADGGGLGLEDSRGRGKAVASCQRAIEQAAATYVKKKQQRLQACADAVFACIQQKPGDARCLEGARAACAAEVAALRDATVGDAAKLHRAIGEACAATVDVVDLLDARGIGYEAETQTCAGYGVAALVSVEDVAECVARQHDCRVEELVAAQVPRAAELLALGGVTLDAFPCVWNGADGGHEGLGDAVLGKAVRKCQKAIARAGADFVQAAQKRRRTCVDAVVTCVQQASDAAVCLKAARARCADAMARPHGGTASDEAKLRRAIEKGCGARREGAPPQVALADLLGVRGLGFGENAPRCAAFGVASLGTLDDVTECVLRQHQCSVEKLLESEVPRLEELEALAD